MKKIICLLIIGLLFITQVYAQQQNNIYAISFNYNNGKFSVLEISQSFTSSSNYNINVPGAYKIEVISSNGRILGVSKFLVPQNFQDSSGRFTVFAPRFDGAASIKVYDNSQKEILSVALAQNQDSEAEKTLAQERSSGLKLSWLYVLFPVVIAALLIGYHEFDRKKWQIEFNAHKRQQSAIALRSYVASSMKKGFKKEKIRNALIKNNYNNKEIDEAFRWMK